jgi:DNA repair protein RadC
MKVRDLPEAERPRERMLKIGSRNLQDRELLALMLGSGLPGQDAIELGAGLIEYAGDLAALAKADPYTLTRVPGIGIAKAVRVAGAFELGRRAAELPARRRITRSTDVAEEAIPYLRGLRHERVVVIVCDNKACSRYETCCIRCCLAEARDSLSRTTTPTVPWSQARQTRRSQAACVRRPRP